MDSWTIGSSPSADLTLEAEFSPAPFPELLPVHGTPGVSQLKCRLR